MGAGLGICAGSVTVQDPGLIASTLHTSQCNSARTTTNNGEISSCQGQELHQGHSI